MYATPPWEPTAIKVTTVNHAYWWQIGEVEDWPVRWTVQLAVANDSRLVCPPDVRYVGEIELAVAELTEDAHHLPSGAAGTWAREFLAEAVTAPGSGVLVEELDQRLAPGPAAAVLLHRMYLADAWRGCGLAPALLSAALRRFVPMARLAARRVRPADLAELVPGLTRVETESAARHAARLLERAGFAVWNGVHVAGLHDAPHYGRLVEYVTGQELEDAIDSFFSTDTDDGDETPWSECS
ncbi:hypothetical protein [Prauserella muralis]|uniref:Uncharacterized protein n=1 Tax=Prauserella muralis TaxID=588067 RepID=A0A2V4AC76_9PSEU|nr:hypothetical protein [Prauserella muralis]PXY16583.1 hypothetical protein BAY60_35905 [Prauserella muralis]TWE11175.1 hypothetical protein FHX69_7394 [Prauserella muralis]